MSRIEKFRWFNKSGTIFVIYQTEPQWRRLYLRLFEYSFEMFIKRQVKKRPI